MPSILELLNVDMQHLFIMFLMFAFTGWLCEEFYCSIGQRKIVKRGMLYGPICPIYGFGGILILYIVYPWRDTWLRLFFASFLVTTVLEYFVSWLLEKIFHAKWWDYKNNLLNINGRVCILNSTMFGLLGVGLWHYLEPLVYKIVYWEPLQKWFNYIYIVLALILTSDILATIHKLVDFNATMEKFKLYGEQLKEKYEEEEWFKPQSLHTMLSSILERSKVDSTKFSKKFLDTVKNYSSRQKNVESWLTKFPSMSSKEYSSVIEHIKSTLAEGIAEQKRILANDKAKLKARKAAISLETKNARLAAKASREEKKASKLNDK